MMRLLAALKVLRRYPSAMAGTVIIASLVGLAIYAVIAVPYSEAVRLWRGGEGVWTDSPRNAQPAWLNLLPGNDLPETIVIDGNTGAHKSAETVSGGVKRLKITMPFDYRYDDFPSEIAVFFQARFEERRPVVSMSWLTPDGRTISLGERTLPAAERYSLSLDQRLAERLRVSTPEVGLFQAPGAQSVLKGRYQLVAEATLFEEKSDIDAKLVVYGKVAGLAGTDDRRRDLWLALLWGTPIALAFGLLAAVGTTVTSLIIAAVGAWYGKWIDAAIQRVTEVNAILPTLPILILIGTLYSRSIWVMLAIIILLSVFGLGIKFFRAMFLQMKDAPYIEAARAYGASSSRIILRYMVPRVIPVLVPNFVLLIPSLVFLEAALAIVGLGDPLLPTWGKVLNDAFQNGALYKGYYHWVLMPSLFLMMAGLGFAMLGYALDRLFNPRLRVQ